MISSKKPILNPDSEMLLSLVLKKFPQSLLLTGENGVGLTTIALYIADQMRTKPTLILPEKDNKVNIESGVISVDIIRRLYDETKTKNDDKRIIIIDCAERMTVQSQNAFLKLLEEPGDNLFFILVAHSTKTLLPTILSRTENLDIKPITLKQTNLLLDSIRAVDTKKRSQILFLALGLPAEMIHLAMDSEYFNLRSSMVRQARELLSGTLFQKLLIAQLYKDNRSGALQLLNDATKILKKSIIDKPQRETIEHIDILLKTYQRIETNGNIRLCLARMVI